MSYKITNYGIKWNDGKLIQIEIRVIGVNIKRPW